MCVHMCRSVPAHVLPDKSFVNFFSSKVWQTHIDSPGSPERLPKKIITGERVEDIKQIMNCSS